ncbi:MAG: hypothetical protein WAT74_02760, partial [Flavobacteriales bacterium]
MKRTLLSSLAFILTTVAALAQHTHWCDTDRRMAEEMAKDPDFASRYSVFQNDMRKLLANNASQGSRDVV